MLAGLETCRLPKANPRLGKPACSVPFAAPPFATFLACLLPKFHPRLLPNGVSMPIPLVSTRPLREGQRGAWKTPQQLPPLASIQGFKISAASSLGHICLLGLKLSFSTVQKVTLDSAVCGLSTTSYLQLLPFSAPAFATFLACLLPKFHPRLLPNDVSMPVPLVSTWRLSQGQCRAWETPCSFPPWSQSKAWKPHPCSFHP